MTRLTPRSALLCAALLASLGPAFAHEGGLDRNGCHYDRAHGNQYHCHKDTGEIAPNPDVRAAAKKSRDNICHDARSPNYRAVRYFISYRSMDACLASGGRAWRN
ncbi:MAG TPA: hypothetical protein VFS13_07095 [Steroidobacteraceae bacterium]|nr:hypothetical protein [Steroidobacteraceae bacterium]